ncbi:MAG: hypothetical protein ACK559_18530, partial [bacterium]
IHAWPCAERRHGSLAQVDVRPPPLAAGEPVGDVLERVALLAAAARHVDPLVDRAGELEVGGDDVLLHLLVVAHAHDGLAVLLAHLHVHAEPHLLRDAGARVDVED